MDSELRTAILKLLDFCQANDWAGYDPYDALNSKLLEALPFLNSRIPRIVLTQGLQRSPFNIRKLLFIARVKKANAIALFLSSFITLARAEEVNVGRLIPIMVDRLTALRSPGVPYWCW